MKISYYNKGMGLVCQLSSAAVTVQCWGIQKRNAIEFFRKLLILQNKQAA